MKKRRKRQTPLMLLWTKQDQRRFIDAVERFQSLVNDLDTILAPRKRKAAAKETPPPTPAPQPADEHPF